MRSGTATEFKNWFADRHGQALLGHESAVWRQWLTAYRGRRALLVAPREVRESLRDLRPAGRCWWFEPVVAEPGLEYHGPLRFAADSWPLLEDSLDLVMLSHGLEDSQQAAVLAAVERVLAPRGELWLSVLLEKYSPRSVSAARLEKALEATALERLEEQHFSERIRLNWKGGGGVINRLCPLRISRLRKHRQAPVGRLKFSLPRAGNRLEFT